MELRVITAGSLEQLQAATCMNPMVSLWRTQPGRQDKGKKRTYSPFSGSPAAPGNRVGGHDVVENDDDHDDDNSEDDGEVSRPDRRGPTVTYFDRVHEDGFAEEVGEEDENGDAADTPLLPIFSAAHLDRLPLYNITHAIRLLIVQRCETTLSWDQLRSPQISQFLVKPIQSQIRTNHFNRATLCALIANCLQFQKESRLHPGMVGVSKTRALISELLAMRLLKEFTTRELIDALSYDFDPLQGMSPPTTSGQATPGLRDWQSHKTQARGARVSTIEIAIRAQAKRFLAHPLVVQHLEAIWAGTIVFHSEADNLHRKPGRTRQDQCGPSPSYGTADAHLSGAMPADATLLGKAKRPADYRHRHRLVTLYDPRDASLFKLSRLRVPRYRQVISTVSFAIMLGLFLTVLVDRSLDITPLEVLFWFWSAGYMLDEVVGFTEQGFGLYILSFWNAFDLGILLLFVIYYCLRLYGIVLADQGKHRIAGMAYDALASTAVLLFPRLFSVLDHYRYFSQLLIAFRMMAQDLMAILVLILISCSGFFVAFTLSFSDDTTDGNAVAYALFQIVMGFTPAAWEKWPGYNMLGKAIMTIFLIICHFLIVTILITVLTNSFMAVVQNANEEHQFLFAVNTISMVKSDMLFSYVAPTNVIGWVLSPLRFSMPFRQYVKLNRTIIKITHFPMLFTIFAYERLILSRSAYGPTDLIEQPASRQSRPLAFSVNKTADVFSPGHRLREPSVISFHKDRALDEVFRRPFRGDTMRTTTRGMDIERRNSTNVVDNWMQAAENEGGASPPLEQPRSVLERLEHRRPAIKRMKTAADRMRMKRSRDFSTATRSVASDPDLSTVARPRRPQRIVEESESNEIDTEGLPQETDADGDDERNDESDQATPGVGESAISVVKAASDGHGSDNGFFQTPVPGNLSWDQIHDSPDLLQSAATPYQARPHLPRQSHNRQTSSGTILFAPRTEASSLSTPPRQTRPTNSKTSAGTTTGTGTATPNFTKFVGGSRVPKRQAENKAKARPVMPPRQQTAPDLFNAGLTFVDIPRRTARQPSFNARALDLASEIGDNKWGPAGVFDTGGLSGIPASFSEQLLREREIQRRREEEKRRDDDEEKGMVNRILLARMHTLEEGFREVLKEVKELSQKTGSSRRESEVDFPIHFHRSRPLVDTSNAQSAATSAPRTPISRVSGNEASKTHARKSPKKQLIRNAKGKEPLVDSRPESGAEAKDVSPNSLQSVIDHQPTEQDASPAGAEKDEEDRPGTAVFTPEPSSNM